MKNECKCNGNCQCGKHPCLIDDTDCLCRKRGQSYPKMNLDNGCFESVDKQQVYQSNRKDIYG